MKRQSEEGLRLQAEEDKAEKTEDGETEAFSGWDVKVLLLPLKAAIFIYVLKPEAPQLW